MRMSPFCLSMGLALSLGSAKNLSCLLNKVFGKLQIFQMIANNTKLNFVELAVLFRHYSRICILSRYLLFIDLSNLGSGSETWTGCSRIISLGICSPSVRRICSTCKSTIGWSECYLVPARREDGQLLLLFQDFSFINNS